MALLLEPSCSEGFGVNLMGIARLVLPSTNGAYLKHMAPSDVFATEGLPTRHLLRNSLFPGPAAK